MYPSMGCPFLLSVALEAAEIADAAIVGRGSGYWSDWPGPGRVPYLIIRHL